MSGYLLKKVYAIRERFAPSRITSLVGNYNRKASYVTIAYESDSQ